MHFHSQKSIWKCRLENGGHFVSASMCYTAVEVLAWRGNYTLLFYMDAMAYPCLNPDAGLANLYQ